MALKSLMPGEHDWMQQAGVPFIPPAAQTPQAPPSNPYWMGNASQAARKIFGNQDLAMALLANSGYSPVKRSLGEIVGTSMLQARDAGMQRQLQEAQIRNYDEQRQNNSPNSVREYEYAKANGYKGSFQDWTTVSGQTSRPSSVQEWEFFSKLDADQQQRYLEMKRNPNFKIAEVNQAPTVVTGTPGGGIKTTPLSTTSSEADAASQIAESTATGKAAGETTTAAKFDLPRIEDNANQTIALLDRLKAHPGRKLATGASSALPIDKLPGTDARDFVTLLGQLRGKQFLEAFNMLKGGGQITEVEGAKAESAIATIQDRGQSEEAYLQAIEDLRGVINAGVKRAREKAGGGPESPTAKSTTKRRYNPATGRIE